MRKLTAALLAFGPFGLMAMAIIDSLGIPLPGALDFLMVAFAVKEPQQAYFAAFLATLGSTAGNVVLFQAACHGSKLFMKDGPQSPKGQRFQQWFRRYGLLTVFIPAVTPVVPFPLKVFVLSAGCLRTHFGRFLAVVLAARSIRYFGEAYLGRSLGTHAEEFLRHNAWPLLGAALAMAMGIYFVIRLADRPDPPVPGEPRNV